LVRIDKLDGGDLLRAWRIESTDPNVFDSLFTIKNNKTASDVVYGINVNFNEEHTFLMAVTFTLKVKSRKVKPLLKPE
jgi:hypothetical protein